MGHLIGRSRIGLGLAAVSILGFGAAWSVTAPSSAAPAPASAGLAPNATNELDCNGWSNAYTSVKPGLRALCTDPIHIRNGKASRLIDNGWYVGHDEPSVKFISSAPGSGNDMTYYMQLAVD